MHSGNASDKLLEPTADTSSTSMRYWYSSGQEHQTPIVYTDIGTAGGDGRAAQRVAIRFVPSGLAPEPKFMKVLSAAPQLAGAIRTA